MDGIYQIYQRYTWESIYIEVLLSIINGIFSNTQQFVLFNVPLNEALLSLTYPCYNTNKHMQCVLPYMDVLSAAINKEGNKKYWLQEV